MYTLQVDFEDTSSSNPANHLVISRCGDPIVPQNVLRALLEKKKQNYNAAPAKIDNELDLKLLVLFGLECMCLKRVSPAEPVLISAKTGKRWIWCREIGQ